LLQQLFTMAGFGVVGFFLCLFCVLCSGSKLPFLDLPEEMFMDVNKAYGHACSWAPFMAGHLCNARPHPIVNIIADQVRNCWALLRWWQPMQPPSARAHGGVLKAQRAQERV
jgi:hypothetical protein